jgi:PAS domain S-box-containing protein
MNSRSISETQKESPAQQLKFEALMFDLSARFMAVSTEEVDDEIQYVLRRILAFFEVDRCALLDIREDLIFSNVTHIETGEGIEQVSQKINLVDLFPWGYEQLTSGKHLNLQSVEDFPKDALTDRQSFNAMGIKSTLTIPLSTGSRISKIILVQHLRKHQTWPEEYIPRVRLLGNTIVHALERRDTQLELEERLRFETLLAEMSARFINLPGEQLEAEIEAVQGRICELLGVERSTLWQAALKEPEMMVLTNVVHPAQSPAVPERMTTNEYFPWMTKKILTGETLAISSLAELPAEAARDRESLTFYNTKSTVTVPLSVGEGPVFGLVGFAVLKEERRWTETDVTRFQLIAQTFANALSRKQSEQNIKESEERFRVTFEQAAVGIAHVSPDGRFLRINQKFCNIVGYNCEEMLTLTFQNITFGDDLDGDLAQARRLLSGEVNTYTMEKRYVRKSGDLVWVHLTVTLVRDDAGDPLWFVSIVEDISERKRMEAVLKENLEEIEALKQRLETENVYLHEEIRFLSDHADIVGQSSAMKKVLSRVEQVAGTNSTVLIQGETGTGKELLARALHNMSTRKGRPLVTVNCAALPSMLIESELFGREKGAFTGALTRMAGRFEIADGSTLFLDEIGELPLELQSKLLRVLEEGSFERLGSTKSLHVDVRIIAATNRDLEQEVKDGSFRPDLFYRLNVFPIEIPPLRERIEDIPLLVRRVVKEFQKKMGKEVESISRSTMEALQSYAWPGNVRELRNMIEHAMILSRGKILELHLPKRSPSDVSALANLKEVERSHVLAALEKTGWRVSGPGGAAEILDMKRTTLQAKMKKLGIRKSIKAMPK